MSGSDLVLPVDIDVATITARLGDRLTLVGERATTTERVELETFDGRLAGTGIVAELGRRDGTATVAVAGDGAVPVAVSERIRAVDLPPGVVHDRLAPVLENRALLPGPRVRTRTTPIRVLNRDEKTVVRVLVEEAEVVRRGHAAIRLRPRLLVRPVRGYEAALSRVERLLRDDLGLTDAVERRADEAVRALGRDPRGVSTKVDVDLRPDEPAGPALTRVLLRLLDIVDAHHSGTIDDLDPEFLHDLRVAVRRSRSMLREIKRVLEPAARQHWRSELKWVQEVTGATRDLDVHLEDFEEYRRWLPQSLEPDLEPLRDLLAHQRVGTLRAMRRSLRSARYRDFDRDYRAFLERVRDGVEPVDRRTTPRAVKPIGRVAAKRIRSVYAEMVERGERIDEATPAEDLHELRKRGKELRYLLEVFGDLYDPTLAQPMVKALKALQDTLGRHQDRDVQAAALRALGPPLARLERGPAALMAMGLLVDRLEGEQARARAEFADRFAAFAAKERRTAVDKAFR